MLNNKSLLITGGTGSFGQAFVETLLRKFPKIKRSVLLLLNCVTVVQLTKPIFN